MQFYLWPTEPAFSHCWTFTRNLVFSCKTSCLLPAMQKGRYSVLFMCCWRLLAVQFVSNLFREFKPEVLFAGALLCCLPLRPPLPALWLMGKCHRHLPEIWPTVYVVSATENIVCIIALSHHCLLDISPNFLSFLPWQCIRICALQTRSVFSMKSTLN